LSQALSQLNAVTLALTRKYIDKRVIFVRSSHTFADTTERDDYFTANPLELFTGVYIIVGGDVFRFLGGDHTDDGNWLEMTSVIQGPKGDKGDQGDNTTAADVTYNNAVSGLTADDVQDAIDEHTTNTTTAHGAVSAATASKIIIRDSNGRAKIADPSASDDIASKGYVDGLPLHGFRNKIINGNFDIWQRGTSDAASSTSRYLADRWRNFGVTSTIAMSRQAFTVGQTDVPNEPAYFWRGVVASTAGEGNVITFNQRIESVRTFAGKNVTLTFWAKADAPKNMSIEFMQIFGSGGSPSASVNTIGVLKVALTTSWQKFTHTVAIPSIAGKTLGTTHDGYVQMTFYLDAGSDYNTRTDSLGHQSGTFDIAQVQLEEGEVATPFEQRPIGLEESLCLRYCWVITPAAGITIPVWFGVAHSASALRTVLPLAVQMRVSPTLTITGSLASVQGDGGTKTVGYTSTTLYQNFLYVVFTGTDLVTGEIYAIRLLNNTFEFDAEI